MENHGNRASEPCRKASGRADETSSKSSPRRVITGGRHDRRLAAASSSSPRRLPPEKPCGPGIALMIGVTDRHHPSPRNTGNRKTGHHPGPSGRCPTAPQRRSIHPASGPTPPLDTACPAAGAPPPRRPGRPTDARHCTQPYDSIPAVPPVRLICLTRQRAVSRTVRRELLDRILIINRRHLMAVLTEYAAQFNHRPHRALNQAAPLRSLLPPGSPSQPHFRRRDLLAGLIHEYACCDR